MKRSSLQRRLIASSLLVSLCTLFAACVAFIWTSLSTSQEQEIRRVLTAARVAAHSASAAVVFADSGAAEEILSSFTALPSIRTAQLWSIVRTELARFARDEKVSFLPVSWEQFEPEKDSVIIRDSVISIAIPIKVKGDLVGFLTTTADTTQISALLQDTFYLALLVFCIGSVASLCLGTLAAGRLARPIQELASSMEDVSRTKNYEKRIVPLQDDEIGTLFTRFNEMLEQVRSRDAALLEHQQTLEQKVEERTTALQRERQQLLNLVRSAPIAMAMLDNSLRYVAHSEKWRQDYGLCSEEIIGKSHYEVFPDIPEHWRTIHKKSLAGSPAHASEDVFTRRDGNKIFLRWAIEPWYQPDGAQGGIIMVTDRIDDLVAAREAALKTAQMRSEFLTNISHELRTPLNGIIGFTELLLDEEELTPTQHSFIESIQVSGRVLLALINDILDYSKLEQKKVTLEKERFDLIEMLQTASQVFVGQAEQKGLMLEIVTTMQSLIVYGDQLRLQQILMNLLGNATKFTSHGSIRLALDSATFCGEAIEVQLSVTDTGIGIPRNRQSSIFEAFTQVDGSMTRRFGGTGLGLSISAELVHLMGGRIWVVSEEGKGATFAFTVKLEPVLDRKEQLPHPLIAAVQPRPEVDLGPKTILVAEDNRLNQRLVSEILKRAGFQVDLVENGLEAVDAYKSKRYSLVLMDLQMPVMNGLDAIRLIRDHQREISHRVPIVALTAHAFAEHREECEQAGVDGYLSKPLNRPLLLETLFNLMSDAGSAGEDAR